MKVPLSWLREYVEIDRPVSDLARLLTNAGLEVEGIDWIGLDGADLVWNREKIRLAQIVRVEPHPDADRLLLVSADYGAPEPKVVVTGAPNLFPWLGQGDLRPLHLFAPIIFEGATYRDPYKNGKPTVLKGRPLRGIYNDAMLCSAVELGLGDDHDGIILIQKDATWDRYAPTIPLIPGLPLQDVLGDAVLEIAILPNIARCTSLLGVAREVAALTGQPLRLPDSRIHHATLTEAGPAAPDRVQIESADPTLNPRFVALVIEQVNQSHPTPFWMQHRLRLVGQRSLGLLVDISNYVMFETGQPNHAFDYDFLRRRADPRDPGGPIRIITRLPAPDEQLITLDGSARTLPPSAMLVTDPAGNLSLGGIMGGLESEIKPETTNILLEAAAWNFINIRKTMTALKMHSEAGFRFSRGVHPSLALPAARRAAEMLRVLAGGRIVPGEVDYYPLPPEPVVVRLPHDFIARWTGLALTSAEIADLLTRLDFAVQSDGDALLVAVPDYRMDIEGAHDLAEELCRLYGYDRIPVTMPADALPPQRGNPSLEAEEQIKDVLVQAGLQEAISYRLTTIAHEAQLVPVGQPVPELPYVTIVNPASADRLVMRRSILASLLQVAAANSRYQQRIALFEIGAIYLPQENQLLPEERPQLALLLTGRRELPGWQATDNSLLDFYDLKGVVETLGRAVGVEGNVVAANPTGWRPGRAAVWQVGGQEIGRFGELHPRVVAQMELAVGDDQPVLAAEFDLARLIPLMASRRNFRPVSAYPAVREDLAFVLPAATPAALAEETIRAAAGPLLHELTLFDQYSGEHLGPDQKSLAWHLVFQSHTETLSDKAVERVRRRIISSMEKTLSARLR